MEELKQRILDLCNQSNLPLECVVFVLKDAWRDADATMRELITKAKQEQQETVE